MQIGIVLYMYYTTCTSHRCTLNIHVTYMYVSCPGPGWVAQYMHSTCTFYMYMYIHAVLYMYMYISMYNVHIYMYKLYCRRGIFVC